MLDAVSEEVRALVDECYERARVVLRENQWRLESLVEQLLEKETLDEPEIYQAAHVEHATQASTAPRTPASESSEAQ
jgi:cell division protease FtsH